MISSITDTNTYNCFLCTLVLCFCFHCCSSKYNITTGETISDGIDYGIHYLESPGKIFRMGFFPHQKGSERRYIGIWYAVDPETVVWVANRDNPVPNSSGVLKITEDGDLKVLDKDRTVYFNIKGGAPQTALQLLDSGNAVLKDIVSGNDIWQSFLEPTDTFLPGMKMDTDLKLTSWKNVNDPSSGSFEFQQEDTNQYAIINKDKLTHHWKSVSDSMKTFDPEQLFIKVYYLLNNSTNSCKSNHNISNNQLDICKDVSAHSAVFKNNSRLLMNHTGNIQYFSWAEHDKQWVLDWQAPKDNCSMYGVCGMFSLCSLGNFTTCSCLPRFEPIVPGDNFQGCRQTSDISDNDEFMDISMIKVENPTLPFVELKNETDCKKRCLNSSICRAYSYTPAIEDLLVARSGRPEVTNRCWIWDSDLLNLRSDGTHNISVRVSRAVQGSPNQAKGSPRKSSSSFLTETHILIFTMTFLVILLLGSLSYIYYKRLVIREQGTNSMLQNDNNERWAIELLDLDLSREVDTESIGIPFFQFKSILAATDNFSEANKLGQGGFGPVYKGKLPGGQELAVKRLSSLSGQGLEEFRNEVILIAKLQHRNLVKLLGYCMEGNEKILVYEYMPNKSLDAFIFDGEPRISLDWAKRFEIIIGIARGLLYLHQDSPLRIIHRDLKTSNILLDQELNPKISDFGLAKIVQGREMEASTNRVIGTYGYMAPEYALDGLFSIKSDVFSFGVVVLEIISGKKNTTSPQLRHNLSLLAYAWNLLKEDMPFELLDQRLLESSNSIEVLKCIIVGLLCVQEDPGERPTMTNVVLMLAGDIASLPTPKQPAFVARKTMSSSSSSSYKLDQTQTNNTLTITLQEGR